jgi:ATP-dependent RNA helicase HelY
VVAPTGAGKTWIAEQLADEAVRNGVRFIYASPLKALSNQKYRDFASAFGEERVGVVTGDVTVNPDADVVVMTTEIFRNKCLGSPQSLARVKWAVLDEFHLIDSDRGAAWEQSVVFAPGGVSLVCLSATISNHGDVAAWVRWVRGREVRTVVSERRPVPLVWRWLVGETVYTESMAARKIVSLREAKQEERSRHFWGGRRSRWDDEGEDWEDDDDEEEEWTPGKRKRG